MPNPTRPTPDSRNPSDGVLEPLAGWPPILRSTWNDYLEHRRELRKPLTRVAARRLMAKLERWGHERALAALEWSMENGWLGVFEPPAPPDQRPAPGGFRLSDWLDEQA